MDREEPVITREFQQFTLYSLRVYPLWDGDAERIELGNDLQAIIDRIVHEKSVAGFLGKELKPMRFCQLEQEGAIQLLASQKTYYDKKPTPVWKTMVPVSGIYSRETILSCMARSAGRKIEKYETVLFHNPRAKEFYTYSSNEIRPVDDTVFVIEHTAR